MPGDTRGHQRRLGGKMWQIMYVSLSKVARPTISHESGEGDPHDLHSLRTKVSGRESVNPGGTRHPVPKTNRQKPYSVNTVWGIYIYIYIYEVIGF